MKRVFLVAIVAFQFSVLCWAEDCHFETWTWDTKTKKSVHHQKIVKNKSELTAEEKGDDPQCTICEEDQVAIEIKGLPPVQMCKRFKVQVTAALTAIRDDGFQIESLVGYRVGKSRGPVDKRGWRTEYSNHSFGTALDVNAEKNGLYEKCEEFTPNCKLIRGGPYNQGALGTITKSSIVYREMEKIGFKWGGEIQGQQKDFMHFSPTGY